MAMWHRQSAPLSAADFLSFFVLNHILILTLLYVLITLVLTAILLIVLLPGVTDPPSSSISLFAKLQWISVFYLIKFREVVLPNASKIDFNSSFHVDLWAILQDPHSNSRKRTFTYSFSTLFNDLNSDLKGYFSSSSLRTSKSLNFILSFIKCKLSVNFSIFELFPYDLHIYDHVTRFRKYPLSLFIFVIINRGYYMAARRYQISVGVLKKFFTSERSERVEYFFNTRKELSYLRAAM